MSKTVFEDEMEVEFISGLGSSLGKSFMPKAMKEGLIKTYLTTKVVRTTYLYIDGKEITDGKNYNPFRGK